MTVEALFGALYSLLCLRETQGFQKEHSFSNECWSKPIAVLIIGGSKMKKSPVIFVNSTIYVQGFDISEFFEVVMVTTVLR